jgi:spore coat polysaccharide biosynthesis protein SpsF
LINRLQRCNTIDQIVVATTTDESDSKIIEFCKENAINYFSGSENDVLDRYYQAAKHFNADSIVRITADCPVVDPQIVDEVIHEYIEKKQMQNCLLKGSTLVRICRNTLKSSNLVST